MEQKAWFVGELDAQEAMVRLAELPLCALLALHITEESQFTLMDYGYLQVRQGLASRAQGWAEAMAGSWCGIKPTFYPLSSFPFPSCLPIMQVATQDEALAQALGFTEMHIGSADAHTTQVLCLSADSEWQMVSLSTEALGAIPAWLSSASRRHLTAEHRGTHLSTSGTISQHSPFSAAP